jgi:hypothetical protein
MTFVLFQRFMLKYFKHNLTWLQSTPAAKLFEVFAKVDQIISLKVRLPIKLVGRHSS